MKKLTIGDSVKIKKGVIEPYEGNFDLSGWQGRITGTDYYECGCCGHKDPLYVIRFDSITLRQMPEAYILEMVEIGFDFADTEIAVKDVVRVAPRDTEEETELLRKELFIKYDWEE